jgi:hemerythrin superfamily protein
VHHRTDHRAGRRRDSHAGGAAAARALGRRLPPRIGMHIRHPCLAAVAMAVSANASSHPLAIDAAIPRRGHMACRTERHRAPRGPTVRTDIMATRNNTPRVERRADDVDALALLVADHKEVKKLFKSYDALIHANAGTEEKQALAEQICSMVTVHATLEEEIFYPAARENVEEQDLLDEAEVEHASAKDLIAQIQDMEPEEDLFDARVKVLGEYIAHHVKEEEEELFPKVKRSKQDLQALGAEMTARKQELMAEAGLGQDA